MVQTRRPDAELRLPAGNAYVSVLRSTAVGLASRLDFTMEDLEDLRMTMSEASAFLLPHADDDSDLVAEFTFGTGSLSILVTVACHPSPVPDLDGFAWQVLNTIAEETSLHDADGRYGVRVVLSSSLVDTGA